MELDDASERFEALLDERPNLGRILQKSLVLNRVEDGERGCASQRVAAKRAAMISRLEDFSRCPLRKHSADGHSAAKPLGQTHNIRVEIVMLEGEPLASSTDTSLHFVEHQQGVVLSCQLLGNLQKFGSQVKWAAFAENGLEVNCRCLVRYRIAKSLHVVDWHVHEAGHHWVKRPLILSLARR